MAFGDLKDSISLDTTNVSWSTLPTNAAVGDIIIATVGCLSIVLTQEPLTIGGITVSTQRKVEEPNQSLNGCTKWLCALEVTQAHIDAWNVDTTVDLDTSEFSQVAVIRLIEGPVDFATLQSVVNSSSTEAVSKQSVGPITPSGDAIAYASVTSMGTMSNIAYTNSFLNTLYRPLSSTISATNAHRVVSGSISTVITWDELRQSIGLLATVSAAVQFDPETLTLTQQGNDVLVEWSAPTMSGATHVDVFRRIGTSTAEFDPMIDTPIARVPIGTLSYLDTGVSANDYAYQVIPVIEGTL